MKPPMTFDQTKPCRTRDGRKARIISTDLKSFSPIVAIVDHENGREECVGIFHLNGRIIDHMDRPDDLVNVPEKHVRWLNIYDTPDAKLYMTKEQADKLADDTRLACVRIEFEEGQFDD